MSSNQEAAHEWGYEDLARSHWGATEVQGKDNWGLFEELFADDFVDHTPQPATTPDKEGVRVLHKRLRAAFPDFRPEIHWQAAAGTYDVNEAEGDGPPPRAVQPMAAGSGSRVTATCRPHW